MLTPATSCASLVMDRLNQITECSICVDTFDDPRVLPCVHTYCLRCLEGSAEQSNLGPGQAMSCPLCRDEFTIPATGLAGLRKNFFMANLIEMSAISNPSSDAEKPCELCLENQGEDDGSATDAAVPGATMYCVECRQALCDQCTREHRRQRLSRGHRVLKLGTPLSDDVAKEFGPNFCEHHPGKTTELYCLSCRCVVCMLCYAETHNTHQCSNVIKIADSFRAQLGEDVATVTDCLDQLVDMKKTMDEDRIRL